ncbi:hypothetical protein ACXZ66_09975 [Corynebacterium sp. S7]
MVVLEYDSNRKRIGELNVGPNAQVRGTLLPATKYVLPTIRFAGVGEVTIDRIHLSFATVESQPEGSNRIQVLQLEEAVESNSIASAIYGEIDSLKSHIESLGAHFEDFLLGESGNVALTQPNAARDSRNDGPISQSREHLARELLVEMAAALPESNGSHHFGKIPANIAIITDEYMFNFYKDVFREVFYLSPDNYQEILTSESIDAVIYVTGWKGMNGEEWKGVKFREKPMKALDAVLDYARANGTPTIFQTIEDPSNFEYFLPVAAKFDWARPPGSGHGGFNQEADFRIAGPRSSNTAGARYLHQECRRTVL